MAVDKKIKIGVKEYTEAEIPHLVERKIAGLTIKLVKILLLPIVILCFFWFSFLYVVSHGEMNIIHNEALSITYQSMLNQLLKGKYTVGELAIGGEAFYYNGNTYTAWGPFPVLIRLFLNFFLKHDGNDFSRVSVIVSSLVTLLFFGLTYYQGILRESTTTLQKWFYTSLFVLLVAFGSPLLVLLSCAYIFHEAILWGLAWTSIFIWSLINLLYFNKLSTKHLFLLSLSSGLALLSQQFFGFACSFVFIFFVSGIALAMIGNFFNLKIGKKFLSSLFALLLPFIFCISFQLLINYQKWGNAFEFYPYRLYKRVYENPEKLRLLLESGVFNVLRIPHAIKYYFIPASGDLSNNFPYIGITGQNELAKKLPQVFYENIEDGNSLLIHSPGLIFIAFLGIFAIPYFYGRLGLTLFVLFGLPLLGVLAFSSLAQRFSALFIPFLMLCAIPSIKTILWLENLNKTSKFLVRTILVFIICLSIYAAGVTNLKLKLYLWSVGPVDKDKIVSFFRVTGDLINGTSPLSLLPGPKYISVVRYDESKLFPLEPVIGQVWSPDKDKTVFWYDGRSWMLIKDDNKQYIGPVSIRIRFNPREGVSEPIFQTGKAGVGDSVYVRYLTNELAQIGFDHWGTNGHISEKFSIDPNHPYLLEISLGSFYPGSNLDTLTSNVIVKLDGKYILNNPISFHPTTVEEMRFGKNEVACSVCGGEFTGEILDKYILGREI